MAGRFPAQGLGREIPPGRPTARPRALGPGLDTAGPEKLVQPALEIRSIGLLHRPIGNPPEPFAGFLAQTRPAFRRIEAPPQHAGAPDHVGQRQCCIQHGTHGRCPLGHDQAVGILACRQHGKAQGLPRLQQGQGPLGRAGRGALAGAVAVETERRLGHQPPEFAHLFFGQRRAQRGDRLGEARLGQRNHIHITLGDDDLAAVARGPKRLGQAVKSAALVEERCLRRVQVFGLAVAQDPPAEGDHPAPPIGNGEDDAAAHAIEDVSVVALADQPGLDGKLEGNAGPRQRIAQRRASLRREAETEPGNGRLAEAAPRQIVQGLAPARRLQLQFVPGGGGLHGRDQCGLALGPLSLLGR